jgi:hypothetical protein
LTFTLADGDGNDDDDALLLLAGVSTEAPEAAEAAEAAVAVVKGRRVAMRF